MKHVGILWLVKTQDSVFGGEAWSSGDLPKCERRDHLSSN